MKTYRVTINNEEYLVSLEEVGSEAPLRRNETGAASEARLEPVNLECPAGPMAPAPAAPAAPQAPPAPPAPAAPQAPPAPPAQEAPPAPVAPPETEAPQGSEPAFQEGANAPSAGTGEILSAPLPGTVFKMLKQAGDSVTRGEVLLILEAMKLENEIVAPHDAVIDEMLVSEGQAVSAEEPLVRFR